MTIEDLERELILAAKEYRNRPLAFIRFAWRDTIVFHDWQREVLLEIESALILGELTGNDDVIRIARASGHGVGKSALVAWLTVWAMVTMVDTRAVITANTESQLRTKTGVELAKWFNKCIYKEWFNSVATSLTAKFEGHQKTWRTDLIPWSENNTEAFAGLHNAGSRILLVFDEASAISDSIWQVSEGALTDTNTQIIWIVFGNPTRPTGRFADCFGKYSHRWNHSSIDSSEVPGTNKKLFEQWRDDYGFDSDFYRVRVRGLFPQGSYNSILGASLIDVAMRKAFPIGSQSQAAKVIGLDVARQGGDSSVLCTRQGRAIAPLKAFRIPDTMLVASQVKMIMDESRPDAVFVDETGGYGAGVIDALRSLNESPVGVMFNGKAGDPRFFNKRSEMYFELKKHVESGGGLPDDAELKEELMATEYIFVKDQFRIIEKDAIKDLIGRSPDKADAVALTFAYPVNKKPAIEQWRVRTSENQSRGHDPVEAMRNRG